MTFSEMTKEQFDNLTIPGDKWRLDLLLKPGSDPATGKVRGGFETLDACWAEDKRRARALSELPKEFYAGVDGCDPMATARLLNSAAEAKRIQNCSASAAYMRDRRLAFLGSVIKLVEDNPRLHVAFVTVTTDAWYFTLRYNWSILNYIATDYFHLLNFGRLDPEHPEGPGFSIAFLSGRYHPNAGHIQLFFRGIFAGRNLREFQQLEDGGISPRMFDWDMYNIKDLPGQTSAIMPNRIMEWPEPWEAGATRHVRRMREPYHSIYLMWLPQSSLWDRVVIEGIAFDKEQGLIIEA